MSNVDHPAHYNQLGFEVWDIVKHLDFATGNIVKYILRAPFKGRFAEDFAKAAWYAEHMDTGTFRATADANPEVAEMLYLAGQSLAESDRYEDFAMFQAACRLKDCWSGRMSLADFSEFLKKILRKPLAITP